MQETHHTALSQHSLPTVESVRICTSVSVYGDVHAPETSAVNRLTCGGAKLS